MPKFSIIIPIYNVAPYLVGCLESLLAQTGTDWEALCVNDGSSDSSQEILEKYSAMDNRIRVFYQVNAGVSSARNKGLSMARGEYVMFVDGDDYLSSGILSALDELTVQNRGVDVIGYGVNIVNKENIAPIRFRSCPSGRFPADVVLGSARGDLGRYLWSVCDKAFRLEIIRRNQLSFATDMRYAEDSLFAQVYLACAETVILRPDIPGYNYVMREGSAIHKRRLDLPKDPLKPFRVLEQMWLEKRMAGLGNLVGFQATQLLVIGKGAAFSPAVRRVAVDYLVDTAEVYRKVFPFLLRYGSLKARILSLVCMLSPRWVRRKILASL